MKIRRNIIFNVAEVAFASIALLILYRVILQTLGVEELGVWSLVIAATALARLADLGIAGGVGRFVATASTPSEAGRQYGGTVFEYVDTAFVINLTIYTAMGLALYWPARMAIQNTLSGHLESQGVAILPITLASFVMMNLASVHGAALNGIGRADLKSAVTIVGTIVQVVTALILIPKLGISGVAVAQAIQSIFLVIGSILALHVVVPRPWALARPALQLRLLRPLVGLGMKLQAVNLVSFLFEPAVKFLLISLAGVGALGVFELAFRLVTQLRSVIASPAQNLLPMFVRGISAGTIKRDYKIAVFATGVASLAAFSVLAALTPMIVALWIDRPVPDLVRYVALLSAGYALNTAIIPAFLLGVARNHLRWNIIGSALTTLSAIVLGWMLGKAFGGVGVVVGASLGIFVGNIVIAVGNTHDAGLEVFPSAGESLRHIHDIFRRRES